MSCTMDGVTLPKLQKSFLVVTAHYLDKSLDKPLDKPKIITINLGAFRLYEVNIRIIFIYKIIINVTFLEAHSGISSGQAASCA